MGPLAPHGTIWNHSLSLPYAIVCTRVYCEPGRRAPVAMMSSKTTSSSSSSSHLPPPPARAYISFARRRRLPSCSQPYRSSIRRSTRPRPPAPTGPGQGRIITGNPAPQTTCWIADQDGQYDPSTRLTTAAAAAVLSGAERSTRIHHPSVCPGIASSSSSSDQLGRVAWVDPSGTGDIINSSPSVGGWAAITSVCLLLPAASQHRCIAAAAAAAVGGPESHRHHHHTSGTGSGALSTYRTAVATAAP